LWGPTFKGGEGREEGREGDGRGGRRKEREEREEDREGGMIPPPAIPGSATAPLVIIIL